MSGSTRTAGTAGTAGPTRIAVRGQRHDHAGATAYVLDRRLTGYDSYRPAVLLLTESRPAEPPAGSTRVTCRAVRVRVLTLDDVTLVSPLGASGAAAGPGTHPRPDPDSLPESWEGTLVLPEGRRQVNVPADLAAALAGAGIDADEVGEAHLRHLVGYVNEAGPGRTRAARVSAAVTAVRREVGG
ncbi:hypothetical protein SAMN05421678_10828 [Actinopolymorpha cephalotaxi]|uniref:Uncharacterized protein n=1 Tax=Actinopolymorpha cephalotaxi TaxID=504797 RepID=A0A1I2U7E5_9ACTN|nr:hypothetical protein [Actinopolymorpha cephalotaxi]NYH86447.1 hypothetical protein [Actinopolymorpha cephalotaxi]SFG72289.1 hypothetical protein SAMN05421678_10828 [Actinopolymorpha cephalotaxi]